MLIITSASGQKAEPRADDKADQAAFESVCGSCHPPSMAYDLRGESDWRDTIDLMVKIGAKGTDEEFDRLTRFLLRNWTRVNINTASAAEIAPVLDVSMETAEAIVKQRSANGNFKSPDELKKIPGVNAQKIDARKERIAF